MELCLGTVQFGIQYGIQANTRPNKQTAFEIMSYALAHGIHWFDTAAAYGTAEEILGDYIKENPFQARNMYIVSKLDSHALTDIPVAKRKEVIRKNIQERLKRLHRQQIDGYIFHDASLIFDADAVDALDCVRQEGFAKSIGVSIYTPQEAMQALTYPQINIIQIPYNVFDHRLDHCGFFEAAQKKNVRIFARSSLLQGLAVMKPEYLPEHMKFAGPFLAEFHRICEGAAVSPLQAAISFASHHPGIDYLLFGVDSREQMSEYLSCVSKALPHEVEEAFNTAFRTIPEKLVNPSRWNP